MIEKRRYLEESVRFELTPSFPGTVFKTDAFSQALPTFQKLMDLLRGDRSDSNRRPPGSHPDALPTELRWKNLGGMCGARTRDPLRDRQVR